MRAHPEFVGTTEWAQRVVRRYEGGQQVRRDVLNDAMRVLGIKPGTLVIRNRQPANDRLMLASQSGD